jgi:hypothetical protein
MIIPYFGGHAGHYLYFLATVRRNLTFRHLNHTGMHTAKVD